MQLKVWGQWHFCINRYKRNVGQNIWVSLRKTHICYILTEHANISIHDILTWFSNITQVKCAFLVKGTSMTKNTAQIRQQTTFWWDLLWLNQVYWGEVDCEAHWSVIYWAAHCIANHYSLKRTVATHLLKPLWSVAASAAGLQALPCCQGEMAWWYGGVMIRSVK